MSVVVGAASADAALTFVEIGAVALAMAVLARLASWLGITAIPLYLLAGLALGNGGLTSLDVAEGFISVAAEIGVLLLLFALGLEYSAPELQQGLRTGVVPGTVDAVANFLPGFGLGYLLGWDTTASVLLGGVTWISSSGVVSKVLSDLGRLGNRETPSVLDVLVIEDLAMAVYLPIVAAMVAGRSVGESALTVAAALAAVSTILIVALRFGDKLSALLLTDSNEALLLGVFGLTLLVGGLAEKLQVSSAIGAFLVGLALSGPVRERAAELMEPLRDLFAATFFLFFSFQIDPATLVGSIGWAVLLTVVTILTKLVTGWVAAGRAGVGTAGRIRAGTALAARGEFSIVIASLGSLLADGAELGALAAGYVLLTAIAGPLLAKYADHLVPRRSGKVAA